MVLPLYLAMTDREMLDIPHFPAYTARMGCCFSPVGTGLWDLPTDLPAGGMLLLDDRFPFQNHDPEQILWELKQVVDRLKCGAVLLDLERPPEPEVCGLAQRLAADLPCPVGMPPGCGDGVVFLPPCPLHIPLADYLRPFQGREIWLEAAFQLQTITVTAQGVTHTPSGDKPPKGRYDEILHCHYDMESSPEQVVFTLFDTPESLEQKLSHAASLGVTRAVGLFQDFPEARK